MLCHTTGPLERKGGGMAPLGANPAFGATERKGGLRLVRVGEGLRGVGSVLQGVGNLLRNFGKIAPDCREFWLRNLGVWHEMLGVWLRNLGVWHRKLVW